MDRRKFLQRAAIASVGITVAPALIVKAASKSQVIVFHEPYYHWMQISEYDIMRELAKAQNFEFFKFMYLQHSMPIDKAIKKDFLTKFSKNETK